MTNASVYAGLNCILRGPRGFVSAGMYLVPGFCFNVEEPGSHLSSNISDTLSTPPRFPCTVLDMSSSAQGNKKPLGKKIPNVKKLRTLLGQTSVSYCGCLFTHSVIAFRKTYKNDLGMPGTQFRNWNSADDRGELLTMAGTFLDDYGCGAVYWPDDRGAWNSNPELKYSTHRKEYASVLLSTPLNFR